MLSVNKYRGTVLAAGDDTSTEVALARPFRFQGTDWTSVFVNSNGNLTFGAGDADFSRVGGRVPGAVRRGSLRFGTTSTRARARA